jgi:5'-nucleotidase
MKSDILLTNDDGIRAAGLSALETALSSLGHVVTVAPDREMSANSHRITVHLQAPRYHAAGKNRFAVEGSPADCVILACDRILKKLPALVISGVNHGLNLGGDINYSGTVSAAFEAALQGLPAIAVSSFSSNKADYSEAARVAARIASQVLKHGIPPDVVLNVNYPQSWNGSVRLTRQGRQAGPVDSRKSQQPAAAEEHTLMTDIEAVSAGYVSVSPLHLDRTAHAHVERFTDWLDGLEW